MNTKDKLDILLQQAAGNTPPGDPDQVWSHILGDLARPEDRKVSFRQLRNAGIAAVLLIAGNIWLCSSLQRNAGQQQVPPPSYNLDIY